MTVEFRLFGAVEASIDGHGVDLGAARQRSVLAVLLLDANQVVTTVQLIDRIWGECPPPQAHNTLYSYVSRLRSALAGSDGVALTRQSGGYTLAIDFALVDLHRFRQLVAQAREINDGERAAVHYEQALRLWRGEVFADLDTPWLNQARHSLEAERRTAELCHNDLKLRLGRHTELLADLSIRTTDYPLDERLAGQFMLALYRSGRQADALAHYQQVRQRLADELGADPSSPLRTLHHRIVTTDPGLAPEHAPPAQPLPGNRSDLTARRTRHERTSKPATAVVTRRESYAPVIDAFERKHLPGLRDRNRELDDLAELIADGPGHLVVEAPMYTGKTALFTALRRRLLAEDCAVVTFFVVRGAEDTAAAFLPKVITQLLEIGELVDPKLAVESVSDTIDGRRTQFAALWERLAGILGRPLVLLLDALDEQRPDAVGDSPPLGHLLPMSLGPLGRVLISSRPNPRYGSAIPAHHPLADLTGARVYRLPPSEHAPAHQEKVERDLDGFLSSGDPLADPLAGMYALAPAAMSDHDMADLFHHSGLTPFSPGRIAHLRKQIESCLLTVTDGGVTRFALGHDALRVHIREHLGPTGLHHVVDRVSAWAAHYERCSWPDDTPVFLREHIHRFAQAAGGPAAPAILIRLVSDERRAMHLRTERHPATFQDISDAALDALEVASPTSDGLADYFRVLFHSHRTARESELVPLPVLRALVLTGQDARAWGIASTFPPDRRGEGQTEVVAALAEAGAVEAMLTFAADIPDVDIRAEALAKAAARLIQAGDTARAMEIADLAEKLALAAPQRLGVRVRCAVARLRVFASDAVRTDEVVQQLMQGLGEANLTPGTPMPVMDPRAAVGPFAEVAGALAFLGDSKLALDVADCVPHSAGTWSQPSYPQGWTDALAQVGAGLAASGRIDEAIHVAHNAVGMWEQATILAAAATTVAATAPADAYLIAQEVEQLLDAIDEPWWHTEMVIRAAQAMAAAGRDDEAERLAATVDNAYARGTILRFAVATSAAAGRTADTLRVVQAVQCAPGSYGGPAHSAAVVGAAAAALASAGAMTMARPLIEQALALAAQEPIVFDDGSHGGDEITALCAVALAFGHAGRLGLAAEVAKQAVALSLTNSRYISPLLHGEARIGLGSPLAAEIAAAIDSPVHQAVALAAVAAASGNPQLAESTLLTTDEIAQSGIHTTTLRKIAEWALTEQPQNTCSPETVELFQLWPSGEALRLIGGLDIAEDPPARAARLAHAAECLAQTGAADQAVHVAESAYQETRKIDNSRSLADRLGRVARAFAIAGQPQRAADLIDQNPHPELLGDVMDSLFASDSVRLPLGTDLAVMMRLICRVRRVKNAHTARRFTAELYACRLLATPRSTRLADAWPSAG